MQSLRKIGALIVHTLPWVNWAAFSLLAGVAIVAAVMALGLLGIRLLSN
jgi:hypothetical protein